MILRWLPRAELDRVLAERGQSLDQYVRELDSWLGELADIYALRVALYDGDRAEADVALADDLRRTGAPPEEVRRFWTEVVRQYDYRRLTAEKDAPLPSRCPLCGTRVRVAWSGPIGETSRPAELFCNEGCDWRMPIPQDAVQTTPVAGTDREVPRG